MSKNGSSNNKDYYLGLDVGTNSVGWAVTDEEYNLLRAKGKDLWGVRTFKEAKTAEERRINRSSRRRNDRKKIRLQLLRELFEDEINKIDKEFYSRINESRLWEEDKKVSGKFSLFNDKNFTDKDFFNKYPTVFHLRSDLMTSEKKRDIRLYFLAINQMMKRRGHFLFQNQNIDNISDVTPYIESLDSILRDEDFNIELEPEFFNELIKIVSDSTLKRTDKTNVVKPMVVGLNLDKIQEKQVLNITKLLIGGKSPVIGIFNDFESNETEIKDIDFTSEQYENALESLESQLGSRIEIIEVIKAIYDYSRLQEVLKGKDGISSAQIARYKKHAEDLAELKQLVRGLEDKNSTYYKKIFTNKNEKSNYVNYIGSTNKNGKKITVGKCSSSEFFDFLKKILKEILNEDDPRYKKIIDDINNEQYLPKQITNLNSIIPYQIHLIELKKILFNLVRDFPSFKKLEDDIEKWKKIEKLFTFRIPYFVGPLNSVHVDSHNSNSWIIKNENEESTKIRPWNFEKVVNLEKCEEEFIKRMTRQCTYFPDEKVLPKSSILYSKYNVLNELNNLRVDGEKLPLSIKNDIFNKVFLKFKRVTPNRIKQFLIENNLADSKSVLSGFDRDLKSTMSSYIEISEILGNSFNLEKAESLIEWITIHSGETSSLLSNLKDLFPDINDEKIRKIGKLRFSDWGRFSKKYLNGFEGVNKETGETGTIIHFLENTDDNQMQLMSGNYSFTEDIDEYKKSFLPNKISYEMVENLFVSPSVKKMIWQVMKITNEIVDVLGKEPKRIFIEMARGKEEEPKRKESRKYQLLQLYKFIESDERNWVEELKLKTESELRSEKLFLYYTQMGKCMYSGNKIELADLWNENLYDIDHIIPRSKKKDDSILLNKVLVLKDLNQRVKGDSYPVPPELKKIELWNTLLSKGLIEKTKYERLVRSSPLSDEEMAEFINRQLVETRQSTKVIADLLKNIFKESKIVYVKAGLVSEFRQDFKLLKERDVNDLHHAHDAFLNIIVGNGYYTKFTGNALEFVKKNHGKYTLNKLFKQDIKGAGSKNVWNVDKDIPKVKSILNKPSVLFTAEQYEQHGRLFNATIERKDNIKKNTKYVPLKNDEKISDISKYGAYNNISGAYFMVVQHKVKNETIKSIEEVPLYLVKQIESGKLNLLDYCVKDLKLKEPKILIDKLLTKTVLEINNFRYLLNGRTNNRLIIQSNNQPYWDIDTTFKLKQVTNAVKKSKKYDKDYCEDLELSMLNELVSKLITKINSRPYIDRINVPDIVRTLDAEKISLPKKALCDLILGLLDYTKAVNVGIDLTMIEGSKFSGMTTTNKVIKKEDAMKVIYQSVTGIYEKEEILNK